MFLHIDLESLIIAFNFAVQTLLAFSSACIVHYWRQIQLLCNCEAGVVLILWYKGVEQCGQLKNV
jgi:hypothetical protein